MLRRALASLRVAHAIIRVRKFDNDVTVGGRVKLHPYQASMFRLSFVFDNPAAIEDGGAVFQPRGSDTDALLFALRALQRLPSVSRRRQKRKYSMKAIPSVSIPIKIGRAIAMCAERSRVRALD